MRITIDIPDDRVLALLARLVTVEPSTPGPRLREPGDDDEPCEEQPPQRRQDGNRRNGPAPSGGNNGPPRNGRQFAGWIFKQPKAVSNRARDLLRDNNMSTKWTELTDDDVRWIYHELTARGPEPSRNGWGGGH